MSDTTKKGTESAGAEAGFSAQERAAMKERAAELRAAASPQAGDPAAAVLAKIAEMPDQDRVIAATVHDIVVANAPGLRPRLWYGMPAYALPGKGRAAGPVVCFVQVASKFDARYTTVGFNDAATLDAGPMWPTSFAVTAITDETIAAITALVRRAVGADS